jgi:hypothetical protein
VSRIPIALLLAVVGCASHETENPRFRVMDAKIQEGITTEAQLVEKLGMPQWRWVDTPAPLRSTLVWAYQIPTFTLSRDGYLIVVMKDGVVESYRRAQSLEGARPSSSN